MVSVNVSAKRRESNVLTPWKFSVLFVFTIGLYQLPWAHKQWKAIKQRENLAIRPWLRSLLLPFYLYGLARRCFALAETYGYRQRPSALLITLLYWFFAYLYRFDNWLSYFGLLMLFPLLSIVRAANYYWQHEQPDLPINEGFNLREVTWIAVGVCLWLLVIYGTILPQGAT